MKNQLLPWSTKHLIKMAVSYFSQDGFGTSSETPEVVFQEHKLGYKMIIKRALEPAKIVFDKGKKLLKLSDESWSLPYHHLGEIDIDNHSVEAHEEETHINLPYCHRSASDKLNQLAINWL